MRAIYKIAGENTPEVLEVAGAYYYEEFEKIRLVSFTDDLCNIDIKYVDIYDAGVLINKLYRDGFCDFSNYYAYNVNDDYEEDEYNERHN